MQVRTKRTRQASGRILLALVAAGLLLFSGNSLVGARLPQGLAAAKVDDSDDALEQEEPEAQPEQPDAAAEDLARELVAEQAWQKLRYNSDLYDATDWEELVGEACALYAIRDELMDSEDPVQQAKEVEYVAEGMLVIRRAMRARLVSDPELLAVASYARLGDYLAAFREMGASEEELEIIMFEWLEQSDWRETASFTDLLHLTERELAADNGPVRAVRWTGYLSSPTGGRFKLEQARQMVGDLSGRVWIDGLLVLDSEAQRLVVVEHNSEQGPRHQGNPPLELGRLMSNPVVLWTNRPVPIRVELVYEESRMEHVRQADWDFGLVLMWESEETPRQVIPSAAFAPPAGFAEPGAHGLKAEYYRDAAMLELADTRLEPALDRFCTAGPWLARYPQRRAEVLALCLARLAEEGFLEGLSDEEQSKLASVQLARLAAQMPMGQRAEVLRWLIEHEELWELIDEPAMAGLIASFYPLPEKEHLKLIGEWSFTRPLPRAQLGEMVCDHRADFYVNNIWRFVHLGNQFQGIYYDDALTLLDEYLMRDDGNCNLPLAYAFVFSSYDAGYLDRQAFLARLTEVIEAGEIAGEKITGDQLATWLMARGYAEQIFVGGHWRLILAMPDLESALLLAESEEVQFWALEEMMVRYLAMRGGERAATLLEQFAEEFPSPEHQQQIELWRAQLLFVESLGPLYQTHQEASSAAASVRLLEERRENAQQHGRLEEVARYDRMILGASERRDSLQAEYEQTFAESEALLPAARGETPAAASIEGATEEED